MCTDPLTACPHLSPPPHRMPHRMPAFPGPGDRKSTEKGEGDVAKERGMCTYTAAKRERRGPRMHVHRSPNHFSFLRNTPYISSRQTSCMIHKRLPSLLPPPLPNTTPRDADSHECHEEPNAAHQAHEARDPHTMRPMTSTTPTHVHRSPSRTHAELQPLPSGPGRYRSLRPRML